MKKKKILVFLLSASLCAAGAAGIAACKPEDEPEKPNYVKAYQDYAAYSLYTGETAKEYDSWLLEYAGKEYSTVENTENDDLTFTYSDGTKNTVTLPKLYTVAATDDNDKGVKDVYVSLTYSANLTTTVVYKAKTDDNGFALFYFEPDATKTYEARLTDADKIEDESVKGPVPIDYKANFGIGDNNMAVTSFKFGTERKVTMPFVYAVSNFFSHEKKEIPYKRVIYNGDIKLGSPKETRTPLVLTLNGGVYSYAFFNPYTDPGAGSSMATESLDVRRANAMIAAAGKYRISVNGNATLYMFNGDQNTMKTDIYGIPTNIGAITGNAPSNADNADLYTGTNSIEINCYAAISNASIYFGVYSQDDATVTVSVERFAEADEPPEIPVTPVEVPDNLSKFVNQESGVLTDMPVNGSIEAVLGSDGYYHVGSANGPLLLASINVPLERATSIAISRIPYIDPETETELPEDQKNRFVFQLAEVSGGTITARYDFNDYIDAVAQVCNEDGVFPVDETMRKFLVLYASKFYEYSSAADGCQWMLACRYTEPQNGLPASGSGTQADPYVLIRAKNAINASGTTHLSFKATAGVYMIETTGTLSCKDAAVTTKVIDGVFFITCTQNKVYGFTLQGSSSSVKISTVNDIKASANSDNMQGTTQTNAILATPGVYNVIIDTSVNADGVYAKIRPIMGAEGTYIIHLPQTALGKIEYDGKTFLPGDDIYINAKRDTDYVFKLTSGTVNPVDCNYMLYVQKEGDSSSITRNLNSGNNEIILDETAGLDGIRYAFTAANKGYYKIKTDSPLAVIGIDGIASIGGIDESNSVIYGGGEYVFRLEAGEKITFIIASTELDSAQFNVTVESTLPELKVGENELTFTQSDIGTLIQFKFICPETEEGLYWYSFTIPEDAELTVDGLDSYDEDSGIATFKVYAGETKTLYLHRNYNPGTVILNIVKQDKMPELKNEIKIDEAKDFTLAYNLATRLTVYEAVVNAPAEGNYVITLSGSELEGKEVKLKIDGGATVTLNAENGYRATIRLSATYVKLTFTTDNEDGDTSKTLTVSAMINKAV